MEQRPDRSDAPQSDLLPCDIVMSGGVTSGLIYPGAVAAISRRFSFHSIGGSSVGAIAAAVTAAAEFGRRTGARPDAFEEIAALPRLLGEEGADGGSRLFHLFTPEAATRPLMQLVTPIFARRGGWSVFRAAFEAALSSRWIALVLFAAALTGAALVWAALRAGGAWLAPAALLAAASFILIVWAAMVALAFRFSWAPAWRANGYGLCTGNAPPEGADGFESLTPWMHRTVQSMAGRPAGDPLTFGDLWDAGSGGSAEPASAAGARAIDLAMIASDISRNQTVQIPFLEAPTPLYVEEEMLTRYFPEPVVSWMRRRAGSYDPRVERRTAVFRLPAAADLPIVFGARLSLSFPVLLSAVPLLTPDFAKARPGEMIPLRRVWFSDGGLTSNFPVHFFDSPIPSRPTFCLNLVDFETAASAADIAAEDGEREKPIAQSRDPARRAERRPAACPAGDPPPGDPVWGFVSMTRGNRIPPAPFTAFDTSPGLGVSAFLQTLLNTARFWSDNELLAAPGVRDRVVNIALREDEGGLNLDMDARTIEDLARRGQAAGLLIAARFDPGAEYDPETGKPNEPAFPNHRWVRYRNFMAAVEDVARRFALSRQRSDTAATQRGESRLDAMIAGEAKEKLGYYPLPLAARPFYRTYTDRLDAYARDMADETRKNPEASFDPARRGKRHAPAGAAPRPKMRFRLRPLVGDDPAAEHAELPPPA